MGQNVFHHIFVEPGVERVQHRTHGRDGAMRRQHLGSVPAHDGNGVALPDPLFAQDEDHRLNDPGELGVGPAAVVPHHAMRSGYASTTRSRKSSGFKGRWFAALGASVGRGEDSAMIRSPFDVPGPETTAKLAEMAAQHHLVNLVCAID